MRATPAAVAALGRAVVAGVGRYPRGGDGGSSGGGAAAASAGGDGCGGAGVGRRAHGDDCYWWGGCGGCWIGLKLLVGRWDGTGTVPVLAGLLIGNAFMERNTRSERKGAVV